MEKRAAEAEAKDMETASKGTRSKKSPNGRKSPVRKTTEKKKTNADPVDTFDPRSLLQPNVPKVAASESSSITPTEPLGNHNNEDSAIQEAESSAVQPCETQEVETAGIPEDEDNVIPEIRQEVEPTKSESLPAETASCPESEDQQSSRKSVMPRKEFPFDVLPPRLQLIANEASRRIAMPRDYIAGSMLTVIAATIGNTHYASVLPGWKEYAILFIALVGSPGINKSHPLTFALTPLIDHDAEHAALYAEALKRYNAAMELPPKDRVANGYEAVPVEPKRKRFVIQDVTAEAVHRLLSENPRGLLIWFDELAGWFKNFNRYNNGSEAEFWMSVFNHKAAMSDRKSSQSGIMIQNPFMCVVGSIQPAVLTDLAAGSRRANGFMERILYLYPANQDKSLWRICKDEPPVDYIAEWKGVVERLISIVPKTDAKGELIPEEVPFTEEARELIISWQNKGTRKCNEERSDVLTSIQSKLEIYAIRFSLLLALADWACGSGKKEIDTAVVERAISLAEYFRSTAILVQGIVMEDGLTELQMSVLSCLPDTFTTAEGVAAATRCGMAERSFKRFLRDKKGVLFIRNSHGTYTKF